MAAMLTTSEADRLLRRLAIIRCALYVMCTFGGAIQTMLAGAKWGMMTGQEKFMAIVGISVSTGGTLGAFLDQSMRKILSGDLPFVDPPAPLAVRTVSTTEIKNETITTPSKSP